MKLLCGILETFAHSTSKLRFVAGKKCLEFIVRWMALIGALSIDYKYQMLYRCIPFTMSINTQTMPRIPKFYKMLMSGLLLVNRDQMCSLRKV